MTVDEFNEFCGTLPHSNYVVQWGGSHVWKVATKVFAIGGWDEAETLCVTFKCSEGEFDFLKNQPGMRPAPYLASRGMSWIQWTGPETLDDEGLRDQIVSSHRLASLNLSKKTQNALGLNQDS